MAKSGVSTSVFATRGFEGAAAGGATTGCVGVGVGVVAGAVAITSVPGAVAATVGMHLIGNAKGGWYFYAPVPVFFIRALLGELADTVLIDQQVSAEKIMTAGYRYVYPECHLAIKALTQAAR